MNAQIQASAITNEQESHATGVDCTGVKTSSGAYCTSVDNYITQNYPDYSVGGIIGKKEMKKQEFPYLLGTLPYTTIATGWKEAQLPESLYHTITIKMTNDNAPSIDIKNKLSDIAGKKITISYIPAAQADEDTIKTYIPQGQTNSTQLPQHSPPTS